MRGINREMEGPNKLHVAWFAGLLPICPALWRLLCCVHHFSLLDTSCSELPNVEHAEQTMESLRRNQKSMFKALRIAFGGLSTPNGDPIALMFAYGRAPSWVQGGEGSHQHNPQTPEKLRPCWSRTIVTGSSL